MDETRYHQKMMRLAVVAVLLASGYPGTAFAQQTEKSVPPPVRWTISPRTGPSAEGWPRDPVPRFTIPPRGTVGLPLPQIGLPLPEHGSSPEPPSARRADRRGHGRSHQYSRGSYWPAVVYVVPEYGASIPQPVAEPAVEPPLATGRLILDPQPGHAQVFVDGYYAGVPDDFNAQRGGGVLEAGTHRVDVTAPGYEPLSIDIRIAPNQTITYRGAMQSISPAAPKSAPATFYLIPGCYMGNIPPQDAKLPATCDLGRVVEFKY